MPLILAVEPDHRQALRLASVLRERPRTEIVIAESAARALEALEARVPDVLLTSPLLSPRDESTLAEWLRALGPTAAHVQALTIPIFAAADAEPEAPRGLLKKWRKRQPRAAADGCEPGAFADHVAVYLERTEAERAVDAPVESMAAAPPPITDAAITTASAPTDDVDGEDRGPTPPPTDDVAEGNGLALPPTDDLVEGWSAALPCPSTEPTATDFALEFEPAFEPESAPDPVPDTLVAPGCLALAIRAAASCDRALRVRPLMFGVIDTIRPEPRLRDLLTLLAERRYRPVLALGPAEAAAAVDATDAIEPVEDDQAWQAIAFDDVAEPAAAAAVVAEQPAPDEKPAPEEDVWVLEPIAGMEALIQSIRPATRLAPRTTPPAPVPTAMAAPAPAPEPVPVPAPEPVPAPAVAAPQPRRKARAKAPRPLQDEWGFFDPEQCGFAALLSKLDEITEDDDGDDPGPETTVRLIAY